METENKDELEVYNDETENTDDHGNDEVSENSEEASEDAEETAENSSETEQEETTEMNDATVSQVLVIGTNDSFYSPLEQAPFSVVCILIACFVLVLMLIGGFKHE